MKKVTQKLYNCWKIKSQITINSKNLKDRLNRNHASNRFLSTYLVGCHDKPNTVDTAFKKWREKFEKNSVSEPEESITHILAHILGTTRIPVVYMSRNKILSDEETEKIDFLCRKRLEHMPIQYILGEWPFRSLTLKMSPPVFIPRPETEQLVDLVLPEITTDCNILDLCTGTGALALSLLNENPTIKATAVDQSKAACDLTKENAQKNKLNNRLTIIHSSLDCFKSEEKYNLIVSNPPYIFREDLIKLQPEIRMYEDLHALDGGDFGMDVIKTILDISCRYLCEDGKLFLEVEPRQPQLLEDYLKKYSALRLVEIYSDFNKKQRFVKINKTL